MCGIFGVSYHKEAAKMTYLGLYALQHRGQESCGIVSTDGKKFHRRVGMGLVSDIFNKDTLVKLKGKTAIGHVRYSTAGSTNLQNAQPLMIKYLNGNLAIAHNGNICNANLLRKKLEADGSIFQTTTDSEVILHLIARSKKKSIEEKIIDAVSQINGAYSLIFMINKKIIAVRDPYGIRPLSIGKLEDSYIVSSESCAFDLIDAKYIRDVQPGELVSITYDKINSIQFQKSKKKAFCIFEYIYFARPDSKIFGKSVYNIRRQFGRELAKESKKYTGINGKQADVVIPVPDSSNIAAIGYSEESKIPYEMGFIRNHYIGRTFIEPDQKIRDFGAKIKYNPVVEALKGKSIILVDDSIVRGTTGRKLIRMLKKAGVKKIYSRISSPPIKYPCFYGIDTPDREKLIAANKSVKEIEKFLEVDSLCYLSLEGMLKSTGMNKEDFCCACFTGEYLDKMTTNRKCK